MNNFDHYIIMQISDYMLFLKRINMETLVQMLDDNMKLMATYIYLLLCHL